VVHNALNVKPCEFNYKLEVNYMKEEGDWKRDRHSGRGKGDGNPQA
jgi:hypothetical protein